MVGAKVEVGETVLAVVAVGVTDAERVVVAVFVAVSCSEAHDRSINALVSSSTSMGPHETRIFKLE
jgi:hypothetical protein